MARLHEHEQEETRKMDKTIAQQFQDLKVVENIEESFPFIRHDKLVRAAVLGVYEGMVVIKTWFEGCKQETIRAVTEEYFDNNYWEGRT
jgi:hypothetical protein